MFEFGEINNFLCEKNAINVYLWRYTSLILSYALITLDIQKSPNEENMPISWKEAFESRYDGGRIILFNQNRQLATSIFCQYVYCYFMNK